MLILAISLLLYVAGFVFLYGVIRVAVRHAVEDVDVARLRAVGPSRATVTPDRAAPREDAYLAGS